MRVVNMLEAKSTLSRLVEAVEKGAEAEIIIARNGRPAARLVPFARAPDASKRLGLVAGKFRDLSLDAFDAENEELAALFRDERE